MLIELREGGVVVENEGVEMGVMGWWIIEQNKNFSDLEWDKLSQNSFLVSLPVRWIWSLTNIPKAFYQRWPWFMPIILHSSNLCNPKSGNPEFFFILFSIDGFKSQLVMVIFFWHFFGFAKLRQSGPGIVLNSPSPLCRNNKADIQDLLPPFKRQPLVTRPWCYCSPNSQTTTKANRA